jgi:hypothetical protein
MLYYEESLLAVLYMYPFYQMDITYNLDHHHPVISSAAVRYISPTR